MTKPQLVARIAKSAGITRKAAAAVLAAVTREVREALSDDNGKIRISELGTFKVIELAPRRGVNPRTGQEMTIPAMKLPRFYPAKSLKHAVQGIK